MKQYSEKLQPNPKDLEKRTVKIDYAHLFSKNDLQKARDIIDKKAYKDFECDENTAFAVIGKGSGQGRPRIWDAPVCAMDEWDSDSFTCTCSKVNARSYYYYNRIRETCHHEAELLMLWEEHVGGFSFEETEEEARDRAINMEIERLINKREAEKDSRKTVKASKYFKEEKRDKACFFNIPKLVRDAFTYDICLDRVKDCDIVDDIDIQTGFTQDGKSVIEAFCDVDDGLYVERCRAAFTRDAYMTDICSCRGYGTDDFYVLCEHELRLIQAVREYVWENDPGTLTDVKAMDFFGMFGEADKATQVIDKDVSSKDPCVSIVPRIAIEKDGEKLSFRIGKSGKKYYAVKKLAVLLDAVEKEDVYTLGKNNEIDFSAECVDEPSEKWMEFIQRRVYETEEVNDRLRGRYYRYGTTLSVQSKIPLEGTLLDRVYDLSLGDRIEYEEKAKKISSSILVGGGKLSISLRTTGMKKGDGTFLGLNVSGSIPRILEGARGLYRLDETSLTLMGEEETVTVYPFLSVAESDTMVDFSVGKDYLAEFYYRTVPKLIESPYVDFSDDSEQEAREVLPPEPSFSFTLDIEKVKGKERATCAVRVSYEGGNGDESYKDLTQETRVAEAVMEFFPGLDEERTLYHDDGSEESLFHIMSEGIDRLSEYGDVEGTEEFDGSRSRPLPSVNVGVSIDSGLMEISVISSGMLRITPICLITPLRVRSAAGELLIRLVIMPWRVVFSS